MTSASAGILALTSFHTATEGPLAIVLDHVGAAVESAEHTARERLIGPARNRDLDWFAAERVDANRLRRPSRVLLGAYDGGLPASIEGVVIFERSLQTVLPLVHVYTAWGDQAEQHG